MRRKPEWNLVVATLLGALFNEPTEEDIKHAVYQADLIDQYRREKNKADHKIGLRDDEQEMLDAHYGAPR